MTQGAPTNREKQEIPRKPTKCRHTETQFNQKGKLKTKKKTQGST